MKLKLDKDNEERGTDQDGNRHKLVDGLWKPENDDTTEGGTMTSVDFNEENESPVEGGELAPDDPQQVAREEKKADPDTTATPTELASGGNSTGEV